MRVAIIEAIEKNETLELVNIKTDGSIVVQYGKYNERVEQKNEW